MYLSPVFDEEDLKFRKLSKNGSTLQTLQNDMIRLIFGIKKNQHINMQRVREGLKMFSVNQMAVYHTLLEAYNVIWNSSSEQIKMKWTEKPENKYSLRSATGSNLRVPEKPTAKCMNFTYSGAKLFNMLPCNIRETVNKNIFKVLIKEWIWQKIPSY